jgi:hypothetical protein
MFQSGWFETTTEGRIGRTVLSKLDRGCDDFVSGRISDEFWTRKSQELQ